MNKSMTCHSLINEMLITVKLLYFILPPRHLHKQHAFLNLTDQRIYKSEDGHWDSGIHEQLLDLTLQFCIAVGPNGQKHTGVLAPDVKLYT